MLFPYYCEAIGCPRLTDTPCEACALDRLLASRTENDSEKNDCCNEENLVTVPYNSNAIPCPLEEFSGLTYKDWLLMSKTHFKKFADRAINLIAGLYQSGKMRDPGIYIINVSDDGKITYKTYWNRDAGMDYRRVASAIYSDMRPFIIKAQLIQDSHSNEERTSVTMSLAYCADARIVFLQKLEELCAKRVTKEKVEQLIRDKADKWVVERDRKRADLEKAEIIRKEKNKTIRKQCSEANDRFCTNFVFDEATERVYMSFAKTDDISKYNERLDGVKKHLSNLSDADWILLKSYTKISCVLNMCSSYIEFMDSFGAIWENRGQERKREGGILSKACIAAYIPEVYSEFVNVTDNYPLFLEKEEEKRKKEYEDPAPIIDRNRLPMQ